MRGRKPAAIVTATSTLDAIPNPPAWLSKDAKAEWRRIMPDLVERKTLTNADMGMVESYCVAIGRVREIERMMSKSFDVKLFRAQDKAMMTARQIAAELGLTPVSRSRPSVRQTEANDENSPLGM